MGDKSQKILIEFDKSLLGDVTGKEGKTVQATKYTVASSSASSNYSSSYNASKAFDGSTSSYWRAGSSYPPSWLICDLGSAVLVNKLRIYVDAYPMKSVELQGSNDNTNWSKISSIPLVYSTGWQDFVFENYTKYRYYKIYGADRYSSYEIRMYEIELIYETIPGNEVAFTVTGQEYDHIAGTLHPVNYIIKSVEASLLGNRYIVLNIPALERFNNAVGNIAVSYDQTLGNLTGESGLVESFVREFTPNDLVPVPNPWTSEKVTFSPNIALIFSAIAKLNTYSPDEKITLAPIMTLSFIDITVNPV